APGDPSFVPNVQLTYGHLIDKTITDFVPPGSPLLTSALYVSHADAQNDCTYPRRCLANPRRVVSSYQLNNGDDKPRTFHVRYRDGRAQQRGWGWLGFGSKIETDDDTGVVTETTYDNRVAQPIWNDFPFAELPERVRTTTPAKATDPDPNRVDVVER